MPRVLAAPAPRSRLVSFRLTDQEYEDLCSVCSLCGLRSLSDFARTAIFEYARSVSAMESTLHDRLGSLDRKLSQLDSTVDHIIEVLGNADSSQPLDNPKAGKP